MRFKKIRGLYVRTQESSGTCVRGESGRNRIETTEDYKMEHGAINGPVVYHCINNDKGGSSNRVYREFQYV